MTQLDWVEVYKAHPRVTRLEKGQPCEARPYKKKRCRNAARWKYTFLKRRSDWDYHDGETVVFCWSHLIHDGLYGDMREAAAFDRWVTRRGFLKWEQTPTGSAEEYFAKLKAARDA